jgi:hypothetical protein
MAIRTRSRRSIGAVPADPGYHVGPATQQPNSCFHVRIERRLVVLRSIWSGDHRAPVAQRIERRPPEPTRLSVVAARAGPRAKCAGFYALREALGVSIACRSSGYLPGGTRSSQCCVLPRLALSRHRPAFTATGDCHQQLPPSVRLCAPDPVRVHYCLCPSPPGQSEVGARARPGHPSCPR